MLKYSYGELQKILVFLHVHLLQLPSIVPAVLPSRATGTLLWPTSLGGHNISPMHDEELCGLRKAIRWSLVDKSTLHQKLAALGLPSAA